MAPFDFSAQSIASWLSALVIGCLIASGRLIVRRSAPIRLDSSTYMSRPHGGVCLGAAIVLLGIGAIFVWTGMAQSHLPGRIFCDGIAAGLLMAALAFGQATDGRYAVTWDDDFVEGPARVLTLRPERHRIPVGEIVKVTRASSRHWVASTSDGRQISWSTLHCGARFLMLTLLVHSRQDVSSID